MTSLQDSFSSISQLADSVAMPDRDSTGTNTDETLRLGLERVRLMLLAEEDGEKIRTTWAALEIGDVTDGELQREAKEMQDRIDALPADAPAETS
jgi:hypothetical protein